MKASVIIPTFNRSEPLARCLAPLLHEIREHDLPAEVIVVDDGSAEPAGRRVGEVVASFGTDRIQLIRHGVNRGLSTARNTGAGQADGDILIFIDDDLIPSARFIRDHQTVHQAHPEVQLLCDHLFTRSHSVYARFWTRCYEHVFCQPGHGRDLHPVAMLSGGNLSIKRSVLATIQPLFDPALCSREDFDLALRAADAGLTVYKTAGAAAENVPRTTFREFYKQRRWYGQGEEHLRAKHGLEKIVAAEQGLRVPFTLEMRVLSFLVRLRARLDARGPAS